MLKEGSWPMSSRQLLKDVEDKSVRLLIGQADGRVRCRLSQVRTGLTAERKTAEMIKILIKISRDCFITNMDKSIETPIFQGLG